MATLALGVAGPVGCAAVLGFESTTLAEPPDGASPDGAPADAPFDAPADGDSPDGALRVDPREILLRRGETLDVTVTLTRAAGESGPVTVDVAAPLPAGVSATSAVIGETEDEGALTFRASSDAALGPATVALVASAPAGGRARRLELPMLVAGVSGTLDVTFGGTGSVVDLSRGVNGTYYGMAPTPGGGTVAAGSGDNRWLVRRYGADGAADAAFDAAIATLNVPGAVRGVVVDPVTSKIVLVGVTSPALGVPQLMVARREATGGADATFNGTGSFTLGTEDAPLGSAGLAIALDASGALTVVGSRKEANGTTSGLALRLAADGRRDPTFNGGQPIVDARRRHTGVLVDPAGASVIGGTDSSTALGAFALTRRLADGALDPAFGAGGVTTLGVGFHSEGLAQLSDGSLALAGGGATGSDVFAMARTDAKGAQIFVRGVSTGPEASFYGVAADRARRIVAVGHTQPPAPAVGEGRVQRVLADGTADETFGQGSIAPLAARTLFATSVLPDGRILAAGNRVAAGAVIFRIWP